MFNKNPKSSSNQESESDIKTISHDLNNLINNVLSGVELLKDKVENIDSVEQLLQFIEKNSILASEILQQASVDNSIYQKEKSLVDLKSVILDATELLQRRDRAEALVVPDFCIP